MKYTGSYFAFCGEYTIYEIRPDLDLYGEVLFRANDVDEDRMTRLDVEDMRLFARKGDAKEITEEEWIENVKAVHEYNLTKEKDIGSFIHRYITPKEKVSEDNSVKQKDIDSSIQQYITPKEKSVKGQDIKLENEQNFEIVSVVVLQYCIVFLPFLFKIGETFLSRNKNII